MMIRHFTGSGEPTDYDFTGQMRRQWFFGAGAGNHLYTVGAAGVVHEYMLDGIGGGVLSPLSAGRFSIDVKGQVRAAGCGPHGFLVYGDAEYEGAIPVSYFDGAEIKRFPVLPAEMNPRTVVRAMHATGFNDIVVNWYGQSNIGRGTYRWDGQTWAALGTPASANTPGWVAEFWRSPSGKLYACEAARVLVYEGPEWASVLPYQQLGTDVRLTCLWGTADDNLFVGSDEGRIYHYNGTIWNQETTPGSVDLTGIGGAGGDIYAVGSNGAAWQRSGTDWTQLAGVEVRNGDDFHDIVAGSDGVYAAQSTPSIYTGGGLGRLWRFTGVSAELIQAGISEPVTNLVRTADGALFGIGTMNSNTVILTDSPATDRFGMARVDLQSTDWTQIGEAGVEIKSAVPSPGNPIVAAWWLDRMPDLLSLAMTEGMTPASQQWMVLLDPGNFPLFKARFAYDPALLPTGFSGASAELHRYDGAVWARVDATFDEAENAATTASGTSLSSWAIAAPGEPASPTKTPTPGQAATPTETPDFDVSGPGSTPDGEIDSRDLLEVLKELENAVVPGEYTLFNFAQYWME